MPRGDRTGPFGEGPKTGRQMGYCAGYEGPGFANMQQNWSRTGRGFGRGFGHGFGRGQKGDWQRIWTGIQSWLWPDL